jgi:hypothetical protein
MLRVLEFHIRVGKRGHAEIAHHVGERLAAESTFRGVSHGDMEF